MTDKLQPLDNNIIAVLKNQYKKGLNLDGAIPVKFDKIQKMTEILYSMRPEIGKYCWNKTIFLRNEELEEPEEMIYSNGEVKEEILQKVTYGLDQMYVDDDTDDDEDDTEGNEEIEFLDFIPASDCGNVSENRPEKKKLNQKSHPFSLAKKIINYAKIRYRVDY